MPLREDVDVEVDEDPSLLVLRGEVVSATRVDDGLVLFYQKGKTITLKFSEDGEIVAFPLTLPEC